VRMVASHAGDLAVPVGHHDLCGAVLVEALGDQRDGHDSHDPYDAPGCAPDDGRDADRGHSWGCPFLSWPLPHASYVLPSPTRGQRSRPAL